MRRSLIVPFLLAVCVSAALAAPAAQAAGRFTKPRVTYRDTSAYKPAVAEAVRLWNAAGTPVRLVRARKGRRALIAITTKPSLVDDGGRVVAGLGGGRDVGRRRVSGRVRLSRLLDGQGDAARVNVAAHELGHALGLGHDRDSCTLMSEFADSVTQSVCAAPPAFYRCGPQLGDAKALARLYRGRARFPAGGGICAFPAPSFELAGPSEVSLPSGSMVEFSARNTGATSWTGQPYAITFVDPAGNRTGSPCGGGDVPMTASMNEDEVPPGGLATFALMVCGEPGQTLQLAVRLMDEASAPGRPFGVGAPWPLTVHITA